VTQEPAPTLQIFLLAFGDAQDLPKSIGPDAIAISTEMFLTSPPSFSQDHSVQIHVRKLAGDLAVAPGFNVP